MTATQEPPARRAVVLRLRPTRRTILLAVVALSACFFMLRRPWEPVYEGQTVSAWFDDSFHGDGPVSAFSRMDSNAVPFLLKQLNYDRDGRVERFEAWARKVPLLSEFANRIILPSSRRLYAAVALQHLGTNAVSAIPSLMADYEREPNKDVRISIVVAMAKIVGIPFRQSYTPAELQEFEHTVLERVRKRQ
jgi:hypothetical protein